MEIQLTYQRAKISVIIKNQCNQPLSNQRRSRGALYETMSHISILTSQFSLLNPPSPQRLNPPHRPDRERYMIYWSFLHQWHRSINRPLVGWHAPV